MCNKNYTKITPKLHMTITCVIFSRYFSVKNDRFKTIIAVYPNWDNVSFFYLYMETYFNMKIDCSLTCLPTSYLSLRQFQTMGKPMRLIPNLFSLFFFMFSKTNYLSWLVNCLINAGVNCRTPIVYFAPAVSIFYCDVVS